MSDFCIGGRYRLKKKVGSGSFGDIFLATDTQTGEDVAIKRESKKLKQPQLRYEAKAYKALHGGAGIPNFRSYHVEADYNMMVLDLLGPSLEDLFERCSRVFTLKTVLMLADDIMARIQYVHSKHIIHRDIKPANFLSGVGETAQEVYIIDFGLCKKYRDPKTHQHIAFREGKNLTGTPRYASINSHAGLETSRRDDLESIGYMLVYFLKGCLPWQGLVANTKKQKYQKIWKVKARTPISKLCEGLPEEFQTFLEYSRSLTFKEKPNYSFLRRLFTAVMQREGYVMDKMYDWIDRTTHAPRLPKTSLEEYGGDPKVDMKRGRDHRTLNKSAGGSHNSSAHGRGGIASGSSAHGRGGNSAHGRNSTHGRMASGGSGVLPDVGMRTYTQSPVAYRKEAKSTHRPLVLPQSRGASRSGLTSAELGLGKWPSRK